MPLRGPNIKCMLRQVPCITLGSRQAEGEPVKRFIMLQHNLFKVVLNHNARGFEQPDAIPFRHIGPRRNGTKELPGTIPISGSQGITSMSCSKRDGFSPPVTEKSFVSIRLQERRYGKMGLRGLGQGWRQLRLTEMGRTTS